MSGAAARIEKPGREPGFFRFNAFGGLKDDEPRRKMEHSDPVFGGRL